VCIRLFRVETTMPGTSIKDIAVMAGVSHSTVSRALRDSPLVKPETAAEIRRLAEKAGYRASAAARSLVTQRTDTIGVVVTTIADPFAACVVEGIEEAANARGFSLLLANSHAEPERELRVVRMLGERRVDGIIVTASRVGALYGAELERMQVPVVLLNNQHPGAYAHSVRIDNTAASRALTAYLAGLGHRRIGYIGDRFGGATDAERYQGFREALKAAGLKLNKRWVVKGDGRPEGGRAAMSRLLAMPERPTAVFCYNDLTALGALRAAREAGSPVPDGVSVTGFDDLPLAEYTEPPLTTVRQPMREMGRMAFEALAQLIAGDREKRGLLAPGEVIIRGSAAPPKG
jgi:DNA-binding LacI/PurR family transcriptional regulator